MDILIQDRYPSLMEYKGMYAGGTSWNGVSTDILKSGIQKYIRRGNLDKALWCAFELDLFHEMYTRDTERQSALKALSTNIIHRLLIISIEDIGIGNPSLSLLVDILVSRYKSVRFDPDKSTERRECLFQLVSLMVQSKRSRELSHIRCVYSQIFSFDGRTYTCEGKEQTYHMSDLINRYPDIYSFKRVSTDNIYMFKEAYERKTDECFYWFFRECGGQLLPLKSNVLALLSYVIDVETDEKRISVMKILYRWYKDYSFKEHVLFALQLILIGLRRSDIRDVQENETSQCESLYMRNVSGETIEIDDYIIDKHTRSGKRQGKDLSTFAIEGAYVTDESEGTRQDYKEIYTSIRCLDFVRTKKVISSDHQCCALTKNGDACKNKGKYSSDQIHWYCGIHNKGAKDVPILQTTITHHLSMDVLRTLQSGDTLRGQLLCGRHKKQVYIPDTGDLSRFVIKGPWKITDVQRLNTLLFRMDVMRHLKIRCVGFKILQGEDDNLYTLYRNIASTSPDKWTYNLVHDKHIGIDVRVIERSSMGITQLHLLPEDQQRELLFGKQLLFKGLIVMALLLIGDVGFYNILVSDRVGYFIDYEETTTRSSFTHIGQCLAKPVERYTRLFTDHMSMYTQKICNDIESSMDQIKILMTKYGVSYDIESEWSDIKKTLA